MVRLAGGLLLLVSFGGCVPPDPPEGSTEAADGSAHRPRAANAPQRGRSRAKIEDEDKSGAGPAASSAPAPLASSEAVPAHPAPSAAPPLSVVFRDSFERDELGADWRSSSRAWRIDKGRLCARGARNHPVWLASRLPLNARIEFDATSGSGDGDIKVEAWGDGKSAAAGASYSDATSYVFIFGGWKNTLHVLARLDEHAATRAEVKVGGHELKARAVEKDRTYHFKIERSDGKTVRWLVDDIEILSLLDAAPLLGAGHEHFGFNDWEVPVCFDDLMITPLPNR